MGIVSVRYDLGELKALRDGLDDILDHLDAHPIDGGSYVTPDCDCWRGDRGRCAVYDATLAGCASGSATAVEVVTAGHAGFTTGGAG